MEEEYDTDAFVIFVIALISIYIIIASIFIFRRIRQYRSKKPAVCALKMKLILVEVDEEAAAGRSGGGEGVQGRHIPFHSRVLEERSQRPALQ